MSRFPAYRPRRMRRRDALRRLVRETHVVAEQLVQPLFVVPGTRVEKPVSSMPGVAQLSVDRAAEECRRLVDVGVSSVLLFALGALVAYWTLPKALNFLLGFAGEGFAPLLTGDRYLTFVMLVALSFGLAFEFPIVLIFLLLAGAVTTRQLRDWRRGAILGIAVFAAIITPSSDPYTMLAMTLPMVLFYEAAIIVGRLLKR